MSVDTVTIVSTTLEITMMPARYGMTEFRWYIIKLLMPVIYSVRPALIYTSDGISKSAHCRRLVNMYVLKVCVNHIFLNIRLLAD
jgi:hypothetical protein